MLKQRREARKEKEEQKKNPQSGGQGIKDSDPVFVKMMAKKKETISKNKPSKHIYSDDSKIF